MCRRAAPRRAAPRRAAPSAFVPVVEISRREVVERKDAVKASGPMRSSLRSVRSQLTVEIPNGVTLRLDCTGQDQVARVRDDVVKESPKVRAVIANYLDSISARVLVLFFHRENPRVSEAGVQQGSDRRAFAN